MNRDVAIISFQKDEEIIIAADNSGSIGMRELDDVKVSYEVVSFFSFRVAWMECVAAKATPFSIVIHNFCGDEAWGALVDGVKQGMMVLGQREIQITGSTETNFNLLQSAMGLTVLGKRKKRADSPLFYTDQWQLAVIGSPLTGREVIGQKEDIAPLSLFQWFAEKERVLAIQPVGSKGILYELEQLFPRQSLTFACELDMRKSAGPSTCFIAVYRAEFSKEIEAKAEKWLHAVDVVLDDM